VAELNNKMAEVEERLAKGEKELVKKQEECIKLQRDLRENVAQKEDQVCEVFINKFVGMLFRYK
jgi:predicted  nucleic acid-binding Zn-ribbon protein